MPKTNRAASFVGETVAQTPVSINNNDGALILPLDENLAAQLGLCGESPTAATVELDAIWAVLLIAPEEEDRPITVTRRRESIEVSAGGAAESVTDERDLGVDDVTAAFLILRRYLYARGEFEFLGLPSVEDSLR